MSLRSRANGLINTSTARRFRGAASRRQIAGLLKNGTPFTIDISGRMGLGAVLLHACILTGYFAGKAVQPRIISTNPLYSSDGADILALHTPMASGRAALPGEPVIDYRFMQDVSLALLDDGPSLDTLRETFRREFTIAAEHAREADELVASVSGPFVGIHYRGSDKVMEATYCPPETALAAVIQAGADARTEAIFVATDESSFLTLVRNRFPAASTLEDQVFSSGTRPAHLSGADPSRLVHEALVNMIVLSRAAYLVRTSSNLSLVSAMMADESLPIATLNESQSDLSLGAERGLYEFAAGFRARLPK